MINTLEDKEKKNLFKVLDAFYAGLTRSGINNTWHSHFVRNHHYSFFCFDKPHFFCVTILQQKYITNLANNLRSSYT